MTRVQAHPKEIEAHHDEHSHGDGHSHDGEEHASKGSVGDSKLAAARVSDLASLGCCRFGFSRTPMLFGFAIAG